MSLEGARVVVTRAEHQAGALERALRARGAEVARMPVIAIEEPSSWEGLDLGLRALGTGRYAWVLFGSVNAVKAVLRRSEGTAEALRRVEVAAVGPSTAAELRRAGIEPTLVPVEHTVQALAGAIGRGPGMVLFPRVENGPALPATFAAKGWRVDEVAAYRNVPAPRGPAHDAVEAGAFDLVTFLSPSAVEGFIRSIRWEGLGLGADEHPERLVACIGPTTARRARDRALRVDVVPPARTVRALTEALASAWANRASSPRR